MLKACLVLLGASQPLLSHPPLSHPPLSHAPNLKQTPRSESALLPRVPGSRWGQGRTGEIYRRLRRFTKTLRPHRPLDPFEGSALNSDYRVRVSKWLVQCYFGRNLEEKE